MAGCVSLCRAAWFRFQELDLSAQALVGVESSREEPWIGAVELTLRKAGNYHKVHHHPITITHHWTTINSAPPPITMCNVH